MTDDTVDMVVVDGVRYRPEHAPKKTTKQEPAEDAPAAKAAPAPKNKSRTVRNK